MKNSPELHTIATGLCHPRLDFQREGGGGGE